MNKSNFKIGLAVLAATPILILTVWSLWPLPSYDINRVCPQLRALQKPYQKIVTHYFLDGGSIGIEMADRDGRREQFAVPCEWHTTNNPPFTPFSRVFVGALHNHRAGAVEISDPQPTKLMLIEILQNKPSRTVWDDVGLMELRRKPIDYARLVLHKINGDFNIHSKTNSSAY